MTSLTTRLCVAQCGGRRQSSRRRHSPLTFVEHDAAAEVSRCVDVTRVGAVSSPTMSLTARYSSDLFVTVLASFRLSSVDLLLLLLFRLLLLFLYLLLLFFQQPFLLLTYKKAITDKKSTSVDV